MSTRVERTRERTSLPSPIHAPLSRSASHRHYLYLRLPLHSPHTPPLPASSSPPSSPHKALALSPHTALFHRFYSAAAVCSPTRAAYMTGRTNERSCIYSALNCDSENPADQCSQVRRIRTHGVQYSESPISPISPISPFSPSAQRPSCVCSMCAHACGVCVCSKPLGFV